MVDMRVRLNFTVKDLVLLQFCAKLLSAFHSKREHKSDATFRWTCGIYLRKVGFMKACPLRNHLGVL